MNAVDTETIWHHQTAELPQVVEHPHRRRILASLYSGCGVLGLVIGVAVAELHAAPPLIPPAAVASHGTSSLVRPSATPAPASAATTKAGAPKTTVHTLVSTAPVKARSARVVADDPTATVEPTTEPTDTGTPTAEPTVDTPHMTATKPGPQGFPTGSPTPAPSEPPVIP